MKKILLPWIPNYFTIALYPQAQYYVAHELQSNLWCKNLIMLDALKELAARLIEIQLTAEKATKKGWPITRTEPRPVLQMTINMINQKGIILRNVALEP